MERGEKLNVLIGKQLLERMRAIVEAEGWVSDQEFIRQAIREKIERWEKENNAYGHPGRIPKKEENKKQEDE
ncbi:MAG: ribbon-helix-helix domain-containing protein [Candidatus Micrarchaeaceae archaeon]